MVKNVDGGVVMIDGTALRGACLFSENAGGLRWFPRLTAPRALPRCLAACSPYH